jgi:hypothetical protein
VGEDIIDQARDDPQLRKVWKYVDEHRGPVTGGLLVTRQIGLPRFLAFCIGKRGNQTWLSS